MLAEIFQVEHSMKSSAFPNFVVWEPRNSNFLSLLYFISPTKIQYIHSYFNHFSESNQKMAFPPVLWRLISMLTFLSDSQWSFFNFINILRKSFWSFMVWLVICLQIILSQHINVRNILYEKMWFFTTYSEHKTMGFMF